MPSQSRKKSRKRKTALPRPRCLECTGRADAVLFALFSPNEPYATVRQELGESGAIQRGLYDWYAEKLSELDKAITATAEPLVQAALEREDFKKAKAITAAMGDCIGHVFMLDRIRQKAQKEESP